MLRQLVRRHDIFYVRWLDDLGRHQWCSTHTTDRQEAEEFMRRFDPALRPRREIRHGAAAVVALAGAVSAYLEWSKLNHQPGTTARVEFVLLPFQKFVGETETLARITAATIEGFRLKRASLGLRPATLNIEIRTLKAFFRWCCTMGLLPASPCQHIRQIKIREDSTRALTHEEFAQLLDGADRDRDKAFLKFAALTGMRRTEICTLLWTDIDLSAGIMTIRAVNAKSGRPRRIPISREVGKILLACRANAPAESVWTVWEGRYASTALTPRRADEIVMSARRAAHLPWVRLHSLRHTACTWLLEAGVGVPTVRDIMGHSSIAVTDLYAHSSDGQMRAAVDRIAI